MPVFVENHYRLLVAARLDTLGEDGVGLLGDALVEFLAVFVVLVDVAGAVGSVGDVAAHQQVDRLASALHASGGVDARADFEYHIRDGDFLSGEAADTDDGPDSHVGIGVETAQSPVGHHTVLVDHRHDVGGDGDSHQVEHPFEVGLRDAVADRECLHQLVADPAAREVGAGIG